MSLFSADVFVIVSAFFFFVTQCSPGSRNEQLKVVISFGRGRDKQEQQINNHVVVELKGIIPVPLNSTSKSFPFLQDMLYLVYRFTVTTNHIKLVFRVPPLIPLSLSSPGAYSYIKFLSFKGCRADSPQTPILVVYSERIFWEMCVGIK